MEKKTEYSSQVSQVVREENDLDRKRKCCESHRMRFYENYGVTWLVEARTKWQLCFIKTLEILLLFCEKLEWKHSDTQRATEKEERYLCLMETSSSFLSSP